MARYTDTEKTEAIAIYVEHGLAEAHNRTGIPRGTLRSWAKQAGHDTAELSAHAGTKTRAANEASVATMEARKLAFADGLMADLKKLRAQLFAPCVEQKVVTLSGGQGSPATWDIVEVERDKPTFADQVKILTSIGIAVDKVQILTGAATDRIDITGDVRSRAAELADELAARRARKAS